jgi:hypothetical protein
MDDRNTQVEGAGFRNLFNTLVMYPDMDMLQERF